MADRRGTGTPPDLWTRLTLELRRDKKKTIIMTGLVLVAAVVGGRLFVSSIGPGDASASSPEASTAEVATSSSDGASARRAQQELVARRNEYIAGIKPGITRDLFKFTPEAFALSKPQKPKVVTQQAPTEPAKPKMSFWAKWDKIRALARQRARALKLQSTIGGSPPAAIINGKLVCVGRRIGGFTVVSISARTCEIETEVEYIVDEESGEKVNEKVRLVLELED